VCADPGRVGRSIEFGYRIPLMPPQVIRAM
jgi:hypothetical protein